LAQSTAENDISTILQNAACILLSAGSHTCAIVTPGKLSSMITLIRRLPWKPQSTQATQSIRALPAGVGADGVSCGWTSFRLV